MGYGDEIMSTGFARIAKQKYPDKQIIIGSTKKERIYESEIFKNNPNITTIKNLKPNINKVWINSYKNNRPYFLKSKSNKEKIIWNYNYRPVKGDLFFDNEEKNYANLIFEELKKKRNLKFKNKFKKIVYIETSRISKDNTRLGFQNRNWSFENWNNFVKYFKEDIFFIQSKHKDSKAIDGVFTFESNFRNACSVMSMCDLFVGWEGGFAHAAAALNKKAVVIFGGWIDPKITGYDFHENIYINIEGSPCGMRNYCDHCQKCIKLISTELVISKFKQII